MICVKKIGTCRMLHCKLTFLAFTSETFCLFGEIEVLSGGVQIGNVTSEVSHFSDIDLVMESGMVDWKKPMCSIRA
jgi:hypothetical protein